MPTSREQRAEQRRNEILDAALEIFSKKGFYAATIADIAKKLGIGHGTFYRYFKNKQDIFESLLEQITSKINSKVLGEPPTVNTLKEYTEQLHRIGYALYEIFNEDKRIGRVLFFEALVVKDQQYDVIYKISVAYAHYIELYLKNGIKKGFLNPNLNVEVAARAMSSIIFEGAKALISEDNIDYKQWINASIEFILTGIVGVHPATDNT